MRGGVVQPPFAVAQVGAQRGQLALGPETGPEPTVLVQPPQPLGVADVSLAAGHVLGIPGVDQHHLEAMLLEDLVDRNPVDPGGLHGDRPHAAAREPFRQALQITRTGAEAAHGLAIPVGWDRRNVHSGTDIDGCGVRVGRGNLLIGAGSLCSGHGAVSNMAEGLGCAKRSIS
jgi:hypothetical protein